ncbi:hypothetical protein [Variovorax sp. J22R115]|uniref:hypothetical protein n=1 Tax=Variovorax sp. J22R115 TaxID=3053509 RepID=UPI0025756E5E|nr:hypothetical protein [Variovorax sp. J22R115]
MEISFQLMFSSLTLVVAGVTLALSPPEKRIEFLLHIILVTLLTVVVVEMD